MACYLVAYIIHSAFNYLDSGMTLSAAWKRNLANIRQRLDEEGPEEFLTWPSVHSGMFVGDAPDVRPRFEYLMEQDRDLWQRVLQEPGIGNPPRLSYAPWTSGQLVNQAFHINQWMRKTGKHPADFNAIFEFGAGYGAMALICQRLGFEGKYIILDLDEPAELQRYYLGELGVDFRHIELYQWVEAQFFISVCALSEVSQEIKYAVLHHCIYADLPQSLIVFQHRWNNFDNKEYFSSLGMDVYRHPLCRHWYGVR